LPAGGCARAFPATRETSASGIGKLGAATAKIEPSEIVQQRAGLGESQCRSRGQLFHGPGKSI
jgi:hypothetical protein